MSDKNGMRHADESVLSTPDNCHYLATLHRCRANMAQIRQSGPDSGLSLQVKLCETFQRVIVSLKSDSRYWLQEGVAMVETGRKNADKSVL